MINWHKLPNLSLNSALAALANLHTRKTGTIKTFFSDVFWGLTTSSPWIVSNSSSAITKPLNTFMPPLASTFRTAAINSNFIEHEWPLLARIPKHPSSLSAHRYKRWQGSYFHQQCPIYLWTKWVKFYLETRGEGGERKKKNKNKHKPEEKDKKFSPHTWEITVGRKNRSSLGLIIKEIWNPYQSIIPNYCH